MKPTIIDTFAELNFAVSLNSLHHIDGMLAFFSRMFLFKFWWVCGRLCRHKIPNISTKRNRKETNQVNVLATLNRPSVKWGVLGNALVKEPLIPLKYGSLFYPAKTMCPISLFYKVLAQKLLECVGITVCNTCDILLIFLKKIWADKPKWQDWTSNGNTG